MMAALSPQSAGDLATLAASKLDGSGLGGLQPEAAAQVAQPEAGARGAEPETACKFQAQTQNLWSLSLQPT